MDYKHLVGIIDGEEVTAPVAILTQLQDQRVTEGRRAVFIVAARGEELTYQWYIDRNDGRGWTKLDGATDTWYTTAAATLANNGFKYYCAVSNAECSVESNVATLYVSAAAAPNVPKTGDSSQPMLYLMLALTSLAAMIVVKKRVRA